MSGISSSLKITDEIDIWRTATTLVKAVGFTTAAFDAGHRAKDMRDKGDAEGAGVWERIQAAVEELKRTGWEPDATRH